MSAKPPLPDALTTVSLADETAVQRVPLPHCVDTAEEAVAIVREHRACWQSAAQRPAQAPRRR